METKQALGDATGLHLGSGPYGLFYSRSSDWPLEMPTVGTRPNSISSFADVAGTSEVLYGAEAGAGLVESSDADAVHEQSSQEGGLQVRHLQSLLRSGVSLLPQLTDTSLHTSG